MSAIRDARNVLGYVWRHPANRGRRVRSVGRAVAFQIRGRLGRPTLATIGERSRMWVNLHHSGASKVLYSNPPDWSEMLAWKAILKPDDLFIDVGSNVGAYAIWAAEAGARVLAVEPDPDAASRLRQNIALNDLATRINVCQCALAAQPGRMALTSGKDTTNHLLLTDDEIGTVVDVRTLDELLGDRCAAGVKIDVEGAERLILNGAERALREHRIAALQLEWNNRSEVLLGETRAPVAQLLHRYSYELMRPDHNGRLLPTDASGYGSDLFAVPASSR